MNNILKMLGNGVDQKNNMMSLRKKPVISGPLNSTMIHYDTHKLRKNYNLVL